jgi:hypothetical protein
MIPLMDGHRLHRDVLRGLVGQSVPLTVMPVSRPGGEHDREAEAATRNLARTLALATPADYYLTMDSDVVLQDMGVVEQMVSLLVSDAGLGAVAAVCRLSGPSNVNVSHVDLACMLIRRALLETVSFRVGEGRGCMCHAFRKDAMAAGWKLQYVAVQPSGYRVDRKAA